jgi:hypothetical protein
MNRHQRPQARFAHAVETALAWVRWRLVECRARRLDKCVVEHHYLEPRTPASRMFRVRPRRSTSRPQDLSGGRVLGSSLAQTVLTSWSRRLRSTLG